MKKSVSKKLKAIRKKTSRLWRHYRVEKKKIVSKKRLPLDFRRGLLAEKRDVTYKNISVTWEDYRGWKFGAIHSSRYEHFTFVKKITGSYQYEKKIPGTHKFDKTSKLKFHEFTNTYQEVYKSSRYLSDEDLDSQIWEILNEPGVIGVALIFKVRDDDSDLIHNVSEYITKPLYERLQAKGISLYDHLSTKLRYSKSVQEYELIDRSIRIIYEKSKKMRA